MRPLIVVFALAVASPAFAQNNDAARAQAEAAQRAIQDSLRQIQQVQQQQQIDALSAQVQAQEDQRRTAENLRNLQSQTSPITPVAPFVPPYATSTVPYGAQGVRLSAFAPAQPSVGTASASERQAAASAYAACLTREAGILDDHISDASTIAIAITPSCVTEFDAWKAVLERGDKPDDKVMVERGLNDGGQASAIQAVIRARQVPAVR